MENLLFPLETNLETLEIYLKTLLCEMLSPEGSPVLYCQMVHQLNHGLFQDNSPFKQKLHNQLSADDNQCDKAKMEKWKFDKLMRSVDKSHNQRLRQHLLEYSHFDVDCMYGLALRTWKGHSQRHKHTSVFFLPDIIVEKNLSLHSLAKLLWYGCKTKKNREYLNDSSNLNKSYRFGTVVS